MNTVLNKMRMVALVVAAMFSFAACNNDSARRADEQVAAEQLDWYQSAQPVPRFEWSQLRQNLIELQTAQAETTSTTTFFFNLGIESPLNWCPSIGFPIPATYQLTNPDQVVFSGSSGVAAVAQVEATGVYTADTTGTYVMCLDDTGDVYAVYWEGFVQTVTGPATWNASEGRIELTGKPSFEFSNGE